ncbi:MAG: hypothetical protein V1647_00395 [Pseudomonadota bacterium]
MRKRKKNKRAGQALVEYVLVLAVIVFIVAWGLDKIKCQLHTVWIGMACDIIHPYPYKEEPTRPECEPIKNCFKL